MGVPWLMPFCWILDNIYVTSFMRSQTKRFVFVPMLFARAFRQQTCKFVPGSLDNGRMWILFLWWDAKRSSPCHRIWSFQYILTFGCYWVEAIASRLETIATSNKKLLVGLWSFLVTRSFRTSSASLKVTCLTLNRKQLFGRAFWRAESQGLSQHNHFHPHCMPKRWTGPSWPHCLTQCSLSRVLTEDSTWPVRQETVV